MSRNIDQPTYLIALDIDNTIFNWVEYYSYSFQAMIESVAATIDSSPDLLFGEAKQVFARHGNIEYPFVIQELPSVDAYCKGDIDTMLSQVVEPARAAFKERTLTLLKPYEGVAATFEAFKKRFSHTKIVALTDASRYVAMWKLNKLGLLHHFDAIYGLADPKLPICSSTNRIKVQHDILVKHLKGNNFGFQGQVRVLPDDYEKPGPRGMKTVLMDSGMDHGDHEHLVMWVGDNPQKDIHLGKTLGVVTAWARYGTVISPGATELLLKFSPEINLRKNMSIHTGLQPGQKPDHVLDSFHDLLDIVAHFE